MTNQSIFDELFNNINRDFSIKYPPIDIYHNPELPDEMYIDLAVAGFSKDQIEVSQDQNNLIVKSDRQPSDDETKKKYSSNGISKRNFNVKWRMPQFWEVGTVKMDNGMLTIKLVKNVPEEQKPKSFTIE